MDKDILNVSDTRDAFMLMLLERIGYLESKLHNIEAKAMQTPKRKFEVENSTFSCTKVMSKTFKIRPINHNVYYDSNHNVSYGSIENTKTMYENIVKNIIEKLGHNSFVNITVVFEVNDSENIDFINILLNMKNKCWIYDTIKLLSEIQFPVNMNIITENIVSRYNSYVVHGGKGIFLNAFDKNGNLNKTNIWNEWNDYLQITD